MPSKQALLATIKFSSDLLLDLVLSFIGYYALVYVLHLSVGAIASVFFQPCWTSHQTATFISWRNDIMTWTVLSLWAVRFVFRWRKHLACPWRYCCKHPAGCPPVAKTSCPPVEMSCKHPALAIPAVSQAN